MAVPLRTIADIVAIWGFGDALDDGGVSSLEGRVEATAGRNVCIFFAN
jgi:hypothetical protein